MLMFSIQIWNYVELSDCQDPWNDSDGPTSRLMWHGEVQMTICEEGPFPSVHAPPSCSSE